MFVQAAETQQETGRLLKWKSLAKLWAVKEFFCFSITLGAGVFGLEYLKHNTPLELIFTVMLGCLIEYFAHQRMHDDKIEQSIPTWKRYAVATVVSLLTWPVHAALFHHDHHNHAAEAHNSSHQKIS